MKVREITITWRLGANDLEVGSCMSENDGIERRAVTITPLSDPGMQPVVCCIDRIVARLNTFARQGSQ